MPLLALVLVAAKPPLPSQLNDTKTTEGWIWQRVQAGEVADLNDRCGTPPLDMHKREDARWQALCRRVDPALLRALLTQPDLGDHAPHGVRIRSARIDGELDLSDSHVRAAEVWLDGSWITDGVVLSDARFDGLLSLNGTLVEGNVNGVRAFVGRSLSMQKAEFDGPVVLRAAHVGGRIDMTDATFGGPVDLRHAQIDDQMSMRGAKVADKQTFDAEQLHVGAGGLFLRKAIFGGPVDLRDAHVDGQMDLEGASVADKQIFDATLLHVGAGGLFLSKVLFGGPVVLRDAHVDGQVAMIDTRVASQQAFIAVRLRVGAGGLFLPKATFGGPVDLRDAHVDGQMDLEGASVADKQTFDAERLHVGAGGLFLRKVTFGGPVDLSHTKVDGQMSMRGANVADKQMFDAERLHVGGDFFARSVTFGGAVSFRFLTVDGGLDLRDSHVTQLDLGGTVVRDDLVLGGHADDGSEHWLRWDACDGPAPCLNLRNAKVGNLQDDERAWPERATLEGFSYTNLGGFGGVQRQDMRNRPIGWWRGWLKRDPVYSTQPYAQLAAVLAAAGNRDDAADIHFFGRDRERSEMWRGCTWLQRLGFAEKPDDDRPCRWGAGLGMSALQVFVGHGIGAYNFRAAAWGLALAATGTVILCFAPGVRGVRPVRFRREPRQKSLLWCFGASLQRVLPLVTISAEFSDFFNDPRRERLHTWQHVAFGMLALCGWALAGFVVAAFSGLIQN